MNPRPTPLVPLAVALALLCAAASPVGAEANPNLVPNPSVETPDPDDPSRPLGFETNAWGDRGGAFAYMEGWAPDGDRALQARIESVGTEGDAKWWTLPFDIDPGIRNWEFRVTYRATAVATMVVRALTATEHLAWVALRDIPPVDAWTEVASSFQAPPGTRRVQLMVTISQPGYLETDQYRFAKPEEIPPDRRPLVSIVFDDGWQSAYELAVPELVRRGLTATHFIVAGFTDAPGYGGDHIVSDQVRQLAAWGHEIGSHSITHPNLTQIPIEQATDEVVRSKRILEGFGLRIVGITPPGGAHNDAVLGVVRQNYSYMRTVNEGLNPKPYDVYQLRCLTVVHTTTIGEIEYWVQRSAAEDAWLILVYHRFADPAPSDMFVTPAAFASTLNYLQSVNADVRPMGAVVGSWQPQDPAEFELERESGTEGDADLEVEREPEPEPEPEVDPDPFAEQLDRPEMPEADPIDRADEAPADQPVEQPVDGDAPADADDPAEADDPEDDGDGREPAEPIEDVSDLERPPILTKPKEECGAGAAPPAGAVLALLAALAMRRRRV